jgi:hypothetical protein
MKTIMLHKPMPAYKKSQGILSRLLVVLDSANVTITREPRMIRGPEFHLVWLGLVKTIHKPGEIISNNSFRNSLFMRLFFSLFKE